MVAIAFGGSIASYNYSQQGICREPIAVTMALSSMLTAYAGARFSQRLSNQALVKLTAICLIGAVPLIANKVIILVFFFSFFVFHFCLFSWLISKVRFVNKHRLIGEMHKFLGSMQKIQDT